MRMIMKNIRETENFRRRLEMCVLGVVLSSVSVGFCKRAAFGIDPFQVLVSGMDTIVPVSYGTLSVILNLALLLFSLIADRHYIGIGTCINLFLAGYIVDFSQKMLYLVLPDINLPGRIICLLIGITALCLSASLYFTANMGVSAYDAVALIITGTWHKGQFRRVRILTDLVCLTAGIALFLLSRAGFSKIRAAVGVGTVIIACFMGPLIDFFNRKVSQPLVYGRNGKWHNRHSGRAGRSILHQV